MPERRTTSAIGSATTRTGTNDAEDDALDLIDSAARMRRQRSKLDRVSFWSRQNALIVWPDRLQESITSRHTRTRSGLRRRIAAISPLRKTHKLTDVARRWLTGRLRRSDTGIGSAAGRRPVAGMAI
jgi:hypothetical protein